MPEYNFSNQPNQFHEYSLTYRKTQYNVDPIIRYIYNCHTIPNQSQIQILRSTSVWKATFVFHFFSFAILKSIKNAFFIIFEMVQSVKSRHQHFRFFSKKIVNIAILELSLVPNESPGNFTYYKGVL